jgi:hypothetical protein
VLVGADQNGYPVLPALQAAGNVLPFLHAEGLSGQVAGALLFFALAVILARYGQRRME